MIVAVLGSSETLAAEAGEKPKIRPLEGKMDYESIRKRAREMMMPRCYVCPECNGRGPCVGQVPGFGGMGASRGFQANYDSLAAVQLNSRVIHGVHVPDTSIDFFGTKISMPAVAAPTGGTTYNMGGKLTEKEFVTAICGGCTKAGTLGAVADGIGDPLPVFEERLQTLKSLGYKAIVGLKPRLNKDIIERMKLAEQAGVVALTIDLDSAGRAARATKGQTVEPKTFEQLKELVSASPLPLLFKGIMTPDEAELCVQAGAAGIVVSNHGVEKYLALGAQCTLVGRHFVRAAHGGLENGVALFANKIKSELAVAMVLTGAQRVSDINRKMIVIPPEYLA